MEWRGLKIGNGYGVLLPKQLMEEMAIMEGSMLSVEQTAGVITMKPADDEFTRQVEAFLRTEQQHRNSYRELAK